MKYKVIAAFMDLQDYGNGYSPGELYPREGLNPTKERIEELATDKNRRGIPLIEAVKEETEKEEAGKEETEKEEEGKEETEKEETETEDGEKPARRKKAGENRKEG